MGLVKCVHSALQHDGMDEETVAGRLAGWMGGTDCLESGGSSPAREEAPRFLFSVTFKVQDLSSHTLSQVLVNLHPTASGVRWMFVLTSRVSSLLVYLPFISEQDRRNLLSKRAEPLASL